MHITLETLDLENFLQYEESQLLPSGTSRYPLTLMRSRMKTSFFSFNMTSSPVRTHLSVV